MTDQFIHHGTLFSLYSAKTRACLSYKRVPFVENMDPEDFNSRIVPTIKKWMIPVLETPKGELIQDTTIIVDWLEKEYPARPVMPEDPVLKMVCRMVEFIFDEFWPFTVMHARWNDPVSKEFIIEEFRRSFGMAFGAQDARQVAEASASRMISHLGPLGVLEPQGQAAAEAWFKAVASALNAHLEHSPFALGARPCLADLSLHLGFFAHQYRDAGAAQQFLKSSCQPLCSYLDTMHAAHMAPEGGKLDISDSFLEFLAVAGPPAAAFAGHIVDAALEEVQNVPTDQKVEGGYGPFEVDVMGFKLNRSGRVFSAFKAQRLIEAYEDIPQEARAAAEPVLEASGFLPVVQRDFIGRLRYADHELFVV